MTALGNPILPATLRSAAVAQSPGLAIWNLPRCQAGALRPLLPVRGVVSLIGATEDEVLQLIECGLLRWAWDFALSPRSAQRKELRVLPACVDDYISGRKRDWKWANVVHLVLGTDAATAISASKLALAINICSTSVISLIRRGEIQAVGRPRRGPKGSPQITFRSLDGFLRARCWPHPIE